MVWNMRIVLSSNAVRFYTKDGWTFEQIVKLAPATRIIFFNDDYPYFIADRVDVDALMTYSLEPSFAFPRDKKYTVRQNIEMRNI